MAHTICNRGLEVITNNDVSALDIRQAVFAGTVPAAATIYDYNFLSDVIASTLTEAAVGGYARADLANLTVTEDDTANNVTITADAAELTTVAAGETWTAVAYYVYNASDAAAELISIDEPAATQITNGGDITLPAFSVTVSRV